MLFDAISIIKNVIKRQKSRLEIEPEKKNNVNRSDNRNFYM